MTIQDIYQLLFGKNHIQDGNVIDMSEHGRVGGVSTGQGFKIVSQVDGLSPTTGNNPSLTITEATVGTVTTTTIQKTIGATTYEQTIEEDSSDNSVEVSNWSEI